MFADGNVRLAYEFGNIESIATGLSRVRSNCSIKWAARRSGFNPKPPLIHEESVYAAVIGRVARLNAESNASSRNRRSLNLLMRHA